MLQGYGSKALTPSAPDAAGGGSGAGGGRSAGGATAAQAAEPATPGAGASSSGRARMWVDRWSERELAPGVWLVRYMELHQPFMGEWMLVVWGERALPRMGLLWVDRSHGWSICFCTCQRAARACQLPLTGRRLHQSPACPQPTSTRARSVAGAGPPPCCGSRRATATAFLTSRKPTWRRRARGLEAERCSWAAQLHCAAALCSSAVRPAGLSLPHLCMSCNFVEHAGPCKETPGPPAERQLLSASCCRVTELRKQGMVSLWHRWPSAAAVVLLECC